LELEKALKVCQERLVVLPTAQGGLADPSHGISTIGPQTEFSDPFSPLQQNLYYEKVIAKLKAENAILKLENLALKGRTKSPKPRMSLNPTKSNFVPPTCPHVELKQLDVPILESSPGCNSQIPPGIVKSNCGFYCGIDLNELLDPFGQEKPETYSAIGPNSLMNFQNSNASLSQYKAAIGLLTVEKHSNSFRCSLGEISNAENENHIQIPLPIDPLEIMSQKVPSIIFEDHLPSDGNASANFVTDE
jgi:hypothetical protein